MCLFFLLWFASGIVMMYVEYPDLTEAERLRSTPNLDIQSIQVSVEGIQNSLTADQVIEDLSLTTILGRPVYQIQLEDDNLLIFADNQKQLNQASTEDAVMAATIFSAQMGYEGQPSFIKSVDMDQWTVYGAFNDHRPLHQVALNDGRGGIVYISSSTGQVLRDTHRWERGWNWVGSTIHWIYPMQLRRHSDLWVNVVIFVSALGVISVITGTIVGFLRVRVRKRYKNGSITPHTGMQKWHHLLGLICTLFVTMFIVSGLFSMYPFGIFDNKTSPAPQVARYQGPDYNLQGMQIALDALATDEQRSADIKELSWHMIDGRGVLVSRAEDKRQAIGFSADQLETLVFSAAPKFFPDNSLTEITKLEEYDNYYYSTHNRYVPLPAYRAKFNDGEDTWYYIDALTGESLQRSTKIDRTARWLYNGMHSLDFRFLLNNRPAWDILMIVLSVAGITFSFTALIIGWRRVTRKFGVSKSKRVAKNTN